MGNFSSVTTLPPNRKVWFRFKQSYVVGIAVATTVTVTVTATATNMQNDEIGTDEDGMVGGFLPRQIQRRTTMTSDIVRVVIVVVVLAAAAAVAATKLDNFCC